jgi:gamma-glutamyltranspeptidase/glutathione hydrolase
LRLLRERGHKVVVGSTSGSANSIQVTPGALMGAADPRRRGTLAAGH